MPTQEFLKLLNDFEKSPYRTILEWQRVLNHILNNLTNGSYVTTDATNVELDDAGSYFLTDNAEYALQYLASSLLSGVVRVTTKTTTATLSVSEFGVVKCNSVGNMTLNLPTANGNLGSSFFITNINIGTVTINPDGVETIFGDATFDLYQDENVQIVSDDTNWIMR